MRLQGRVALITGAGRGLGRGIALRFAAEGARLALADLDGQAAQEALSEAVRVSANSSMPCSSHTVDVSSSQSVEQLVSETVAAVGPPDIVINCAGVNCKIPFLEMSERAWDQVLDVNLKGTFLVSLLAARQMKQGSIINFSSVNSDLTTGDIVAYAASKGGVRSMTRAMAVALAPKGIRVNAIAPGPCETKMTEKTRSQPGGSERLLARVALKRFGTPDDIASIVLFLASDESAFITGSTLYADGGLSAVR